MEPRNITDYHDTSRHTDEENMAFCVKLFSDLIENTPGCQNDVLLELVSDARKWEQLRRGIRDLNAWLINHRSSWIIVNGQSYGTEFWLEHLAEHDVVKKGGSFQRPPEDQEHLYMTASYDIETGEDDPENRVAWIPLPDLG